MSKQGVAPKAEAKAGRVDAERLNALSGKRIYFGHQSVGYNILEGLNGVLGEYPGATPKIVEFDERGAPPAIPGILHSKIGKNGAPVRKIEAFREVVTEKGPWDVAFFKFCYVDFYEHAKVEEIFEAYRKAVAEIRQKRPAVLVVHVTVPLTTGGFTLKERVRSMLGRKEIEYLGNVARNRFNDMLRAEYGGKAPLFDLARIESMRPDGTRASFEFSGRSYERLAGEYTDDGGHLNARGRKVAASEFLAFLAGLPDKN